MIGERVRALRRRLALSQKDLAARAGVAEKTINSLEQNKLTPQLRTVRKLAVVLGVEPYELLGETKAAA